MYYSIIGIQNHNFGASGVANYQNIAATSADLWRSTEAAVVQTVPTAMQLTNFYLETQNAPGTGQSIVYMIHKNGADTGLTFTFTGASTRSGLCTETVSFAAGDTISFVATPTSVANNTGLMFWSFLAIGASQNIFVSNSAGNFPSTTVANYSSILGGGFGNWTATEATVSNPMPAAGTLSNLCVNTDVAAGGANTYTFKVRKGGSDTTSVATLTGAALTASDNTHTVAVVAGDVVALSSTPSSPAAPTNVSLSLAFTPTTAGDCVFGFSAGSGNGSNTVFNSAVPFGVGFNWDLLVNESNDYIQPGPCNLKSFYVNLDTAPGGSASWTFAIRKNRIDTALAVTVSAAATTGNTSSTVQLSQGDKLTMGSTPASTPTAAAKRFAYCLNFTQNHGFFMPF